MKEEYSCDRYEILNLILSKIFQTDQTKINAKQLFKDLKNYSCFDSIDCKIKLNQINLNLANILFSPICTIIKQIEEK